MTRCIPGSNSPSKNHPHVTAVLSSLPGEKDEPVPDPADRRGSRGNRRLARITLRMPAAGGNQVFPPDENQQMVGDNFGVTDDGGWDGSGSADLGGGWDS